METSRDNNPFGFPPALIAKLEAIADEQHRPIAELVRELVEERLHTLELDLLDDDPPMTDEYRQTIHEKISVGLQSLREGKGTDGNTFFTEMYSELEALEQQGR
jgi:hypothetical protein